MTKHMGDKQPNENIPNTLRLVAFVSIVGGVLFGYGFGVGLGVFPGRGFLVGAIVYTFTAIGAVLVSLTGLVAIWLGVRGPSQSLTKPGAAAISVFAPVIGVAALAPIPTDSPFWTFVGQAILSLQFFVGFSTPRSRRVLVLSAETVAVAGLVATSYVGTTEWVNVGTLLLLSASGAVLFLIFGGPFFLLGSRFDAPTNGSSEE